MPEEQVPQEPATTETPAAPTPREQARAYISQQNAARKERIRQGLTEAFSYSENGQTTLWFDQVFDYDIVPEDTVVCETPLQVGSHQGSLFVVLNASRDNAEPLEFPEDATIAFSFLTAKTEDGEYSDIAPTVCVKAPKDGMSYEPGETITRVMLPNFPLPWCKLKLEFSGEITGGTIIAGLGYAAR